MKNNKKLVEFIGYCLEHPELRFWQALRDWSGYYCILGWRPRKPVHLKEDGSNDIEGLEELKKLGLEDTFYWE